MTIGKKINKKTKLLKTNFSLPPESTLFYLNFQTDFHLNRKRDVNSPKNDRNYSISFLGKLLFIYILSQNLQIFY